MSTHSAAKRKLLLLGVDDALDTHVHSWSLQNIPPGVRAGAAARPDLQRDVPVSQLVRTAEANGFSGMILVQARDAGEDVGVEIDHFREAADQYPAMILGCIIGVDLRQPDELSYLLRASGLMMHAKFVLGVRMIRPQEVKPGDPDEHIYLHPKTTDSALRLARENITLDLLVRSSFPGQVADLLAFVDGLNGRGPRLVVDHLLKPEGLLTGVPAPEWQDAMTKLAAHPNVWMKVSGLPGELSRHHYDPLSFYPFFDRALDTFGPDRIIFGSDHPVSWAHEEWVVAVADWAESRRSKVDPVKLFRTNAIRAYGMTFG